MKVTYIAIKPSTTAIYTPELVKVPFGAVNEKTGVKMRRVTAAFLPDASGFAKFSTDDSEMIKWLDNHDMFDKVPGIARYDSKIHVAAPSTAVVTAGVTTTVQTPAIKSLPSKKGRPVAA